MLMGGNPETQMETNGEREYKNMTTELLQEVSLPLTATSEPIPAVSVPVPQPVVNLELSQPSAIFSPAVDTEIQARFAALRAGSQTVPETSTAFSFGQR